MAPQTPRRRVRKRRRLDVASLLVLPLGILIVVGAQLIEGGSPQALLQAAAALIVFGGTAAAVLISYSPTEVRRAIRGMAATFKVQPDTTDSLAQNLVAISGRAHRKGIMSLENELDSIQDPFLRDGLTLVVDGIEIEALRDIVVTERRARDADDEAPARVFEAAAGYAPTLGILGAVIGLIQVMQHLSEPGALGSGIAVAFVATVYGVGSANLIFLPLAGRLRERAAIASRHRDLIAEALFAIHARMNPRLIAHKLRVLSA
jgi:chemotaxis protein MotA